MSRDHYTFLLLPRYVGHVDVECVVLGSESDNTISHNNAAHNQCCYRTESKGDR